MADLITRWDKWFCEDNLRKDERILMAPPSTSAKEAAAAFKSRGKRVLADKGPLVLTALAGDPEAGLPAVQLFTREMFADATQGLRPVEMRVGDDTGCTGRTDYLIWYGLFEKPADSRETRAAMGCWCLGGCRIVTTELYTCDIIKVQSCCYSEPELE
jgi:hypothetical protein